MTLERNIPRRAAVTSPHSTLVEPADIRAFIERQVAAVEADNAKALVQWQTKSLEERANGITACCETAAETMKARQQMGIPPMSREPWPAAIWDMLRKHASDAQNQPYDPR